MDASIAAALEAGRSVIAPSPQRAAALRWNWARVQRTRGRQVWSTPDILTWDAWLDARWEQSQRLGRPSGLRRLNRSQQRRLWEQVLRDLAPGFAPGEDLAPHASALMDAAGEATQYLLNLPRLAVSDEERLLVAAMAEVHRWCQRHDSIILPLAMPETLAGFLRGSLPPLLSGQRSATPLQQRLSGLCWAGVSLLPEAATDEAWDFRRVRAASLDAELQACAQWCRQLLEEHGERRLLVVSAAGNPSLAMQAQVLWRELSRGTADEALPANHQLLAVEGGQRLDHHALVADALAALRLLAGEVSWPDLSQVLRSAYLMIGSPAGMLQLEQALAAVGTVRWSREALDRTLRRLDASCPAAGALAQWLQSVTGDEGQRAPSVTWAGLFSEWLGAAGFARAATLDSEDAQRLRRWGELLDEFAALDAVLAPLSRAEALSTLKQLAGETVHAAESGDAAITLTAQRVAPLASYDGIWVLGLAEQRWPEPPRPDPYVPLSEQRRGGWDAAGTRQRLEQARWIQRQWQCATPRLVLSHAQRDGDLRLRPSALLLAAGTLEWEEAQDQSPEAGCYARIAVRGRLPPHQGDAGRPLPRGLQRLRLQQACAFRSQAETRLGALPPPFISDGIHPAVRGQLLHAVLERLWQQIGSQEQLLRLDEAARRALVARHWALALRAMVDAGGPI